MNPDIHDPNKYAAVALDKECARVADATEGHRNNTLNNAALALGKLIPGGYLDEADVVNALTDAATRAGLPPSEIAATICSGLNKGKEQPHQLAGRNGLVRNGHPPGPPVPPKTSPAYPWPKPVPLDQLEDTDPDADWLWRGLLARHGFTLFWALWKGGKTTLLAHLLRACQHGGTFCGLQLKPLRVLYVSEEHRKLWVARRDELQLGGWVHVLCRPYSHQPTLPEWEAFIDFLAEERTAMAADLVVIDTISRFWPVQDENNASQVNATLLPLQRLTEHAALLATHHPRKTGGDDATSCRGSGTLGATPEILLELAYAVPGDRANRRRVLTARGRYPDVLEDRLVIELAPDGGSYTAHGSPQHVACRQLQDTIADMLPCAPGWTWEEVKEHWPDEDGPGKTKLVKALNAGYDARRWGRDGLAKKGSPHTYFATP
jgi:hypothetical protein